jgi:outer membrane autotransporter protein
LTINSNAAWSFGNMLTGGGLLAVDLGSSANSFDFAATSGTAFSGTVQLGRATYALADGSTNEAALGNATLRMTAGSIVNLGTNGALNNGLKIHGLDLVDGTLNVKMRDLDTVHVLTVDNLIVGNANTVTVNLDTATLSVPATLGGNLIDQANLNEGMQVVSAGSVDVSGKQLGLTLDGVATTGTTYTGVSDGHGNNDLELTYDYTGISSSSTNGQGPGLYVDYLLTELKTNSNAVLDMSGANNDGFGARITGTGDLTVMASGTTLALLSGSNDYSGRTLVDGGTLVVGADGALGNTSVLDINSAAGVDLNGRNQTIGSFSGSANSELNLNGGTLSISGSDINGNPLDSVSNGLLTGSGIVNVDGGSFAISGSNSISGQVNIADAALVTVDDVAGLGVSDIAISGSLVLDSANDGSFINRIGGDGALVKQGTSTVAINQANDAFAGSTEVGEGTLVVTDIAGVGTSDVTVENGGTFAYYGVSGTLQNHVSGSGVLVMANSDLTATDAVTVDVEQSILSSGTLQLDTANVFGRNIRVDAASQVDFLRDGVRLGNVENHGLLNFGDGSGGFKTATVGDLSGSGFIAMNVNVTAEQGDKLFAGVTTGTHGIVFNRLDAPGATTGKEKILLIETTDSSAGAFISGTLADGMYKYTVVDGASNRNLDGNANNWWLMGNGLSTDGKVIISVAGASSLGWFADTDSLLKRMGDLRLDYEQLGDRMNFAKHAEGDVWVRTYGQQINAGGSASGASFQDTLWGTDIGADKLWQLDANNMLYTGVYGGYGQSSLDFRGVSASAESNNYQGGFYATWLHDSGWYADLVGKASYLDNSFETFDLSGKNRGEYNNWAAGASLEFGRKFQFKDGWFAEPQVQLGYVHVFGADYTTRGTSDLAVSQGDADILQVRFGSLFGRTVRLANNGLLQPYVKVMGVEQVSSGGTVRADDGQWRPNYDGPRAQVGAGIIWQLDDRNQIHLDYEAEFGDKFDKPWGINAGYRHQF